MTLVETLLGMALLATLLVGVLYADGEVRVQSRLARRASEACEVADAILRDRLTAGVLGECDSGVVAEHPDWRWEVTPSEDVFEKPSKFGNSRVVTFTLRDTTLQKDLVRVGLLVPQEEEDE